MKKAQNDFSDCVAVCIKVRMAEIGYSRKKAAEKSFMKYSTFCSKLNNPKTFTVGELVRVFDALSVDYKSVVERYGVA